MRDLPVRIAELLRLPKESRVGDKAGKRPGPADFLLEVYELTKSTQEPLVDPRKFMHAPTVPATGKGLVNVKDAHGAGLAQGLLK